MFIAFLGLGRMGKPMVRNLLKQGHSVTVYNRTPGKAAALIALGAKEAKTVAEAVKGSEVAITMLTDDTAVNEVAQGPSGLIQNLPPKAIHLCMSTIGIETSTALASAHAQANQGYVAAPVFGRADTTESRHIWIVAGGREPHVNRCRPIFEALSQGYTHVSSNASLAHALKLGGNLLSMAIEMAVSELLIYARKSGLPPADYLRCLNTAVFRSHLVGDYGGAAIRPSFDPDDQTLDLAASELLLEKAKEMGVAIPTEDLLNVRLQAASARGWGELDLAELSKAYLDETGRNATVPPKPQAPPSAPPGGPVKEPPRPRPDKVQAPKEALTPPRTGPQAAPPIVRVVQPVPSKSKPGRPSKESLPSLQPNPRAVPPVISKEAPAKPSSVPPGSSKEGPSSKPVLPQNLFIAMDGTDKITLDLERISHFEMIKDQVWAWSQGKKYATPWQSLVEVESAFNHVMFLLIKRHVLLRPDAVIHFRPTFGGTAKVRVDENLELYVSRAAAPRLKVMLGI